MNAAKSLAKRMLAKMGYEMRRKPSELAQAQAQAPPPHLGQDPFLNMQSLAQQKQPPIIFDVGANLGQSIFQFRYVFPASQIHAFEPGRRTFAELSKKTSDLSNLFLNNVGLGSEVGKLKFIENSSSEMSSFLEPGEDCWGAVAARVDVPLDTVDSYCGKNKIKAIDILKIDTQGFDFEVIKGATTLLSENRVHLIFTEVIFSEIYKGIPRFDELFGFLADRGFSLVSFYEMYYRRERLSWTDALFINPQYIKAL